VLGVETPANAQSTSADKALGGLPAPSLTGGRLAALGLPAPNGLLGDGRLYPDPPERQSGHECQV
jgi:hypothetical protein